MKALTIKASGCPNACGQHWIGDIGFYGNARKIDGKEVPYYQMLLGGGYDEEGIMRFGLAVQSHSGAPGARGRARVLDHFIANRVEGESFRAVRAAPQGGDVPRIDSRARQARRALPRDLPGLGRRRGILAATRPRRVRRVRRDSR